MPSFHVCLRATALSAWAATLLVAGTAHASDGSENSDHTTIGGGVLLERAPFKGASTQVLPIPYVSISRGPFYLDSGEAGVTLRTGGETALVNADLFVAARSRSGRDRFKVAADAGARVGLTTPAGTLSAEVRHDISGLSAGSEITGRYSYPISLGELTLTPAAQVTWLDRDAANFLYGITPAQRAEMIKKKRRVILPVAPITQHAYVLGGDLTATYALSDRITLLGVAGGSYLGKPIRRSPAIDQKWDATIVLGAAYTF